MDTGLVATVVGSVAGVGSCVLAWRQVRLTRRAGSGGGGSPRRPRRSTGAGMTLRPPLGLLPPVVRGRETVQDTFRPLIRRPDGRLHVVTGLAGSGKTTVALWAADEGLRADLDVCWIPAGDPASMTDALIELAHELGAPPSEVEAAFTGPRSAPDLVWRLLQARRKWILVFDNADDPALLSRGGAAVVDETGWVRSSTAGLVVVTTRAGDPAVWGRNAVLHRLGPLGSDEGALILHDLAPDAGSLAEATALSRRLGGLALALMCAGRHMRSGFATERTYGAYLSALDERITEMLGASSNGADAVTETLDLSLDRLATQGAPGARTLLRLLSGFAPGTPIPTRLLDRDVLEPVCEGERLTTLLTLLASAGLVEAYAGGDPMLHPLVAELSFQSMPADQAGRLGHLRVLLLEKEIAGLASDRPGDWPEWNRLAPHVRVMMRQPPEHLPRDDARSVIRLAASTAWALARGGIHAGSVGLAGDAVAAAALRLDDDRFTMARARDALAAGLHRSGDPATALDEYREILTGDLASLGPDEPDVLRIRNEFARALADLGRYREAAAEFGAVLEARTRTLGPRDKGTLTARHGRAFALAEAGDLEEAEREFREVLAARTETLGAAHPSTMTTQHELARVLMRVGSLDQADAMLDELLARRLDALGPDHPHTLMTESELAAVLALRGERRQAERRFREVLAGQRRVLGPDHPNTLSTRRELALLMRRTGQARLELSRTLDAQARVLGPDHPATVRTRAALASLEPVGDG